MNTTKSTKIGVAVALLLATVALGLPVSASAAAPTKLRAMDAVKREVRASFPRLGPPWNIQVACMRLSRTFFKCTFDADAIRESSSRVERGCGSTRAPPT